MKRVKINGEWVEVKDADVEEAPASPEVTPEGEEAEEEKSIMAKAKKIGAEIAKEAMSHLDIGVDTDLKKKLDRVIEHQFGGDSKLKQILNGKDLYAGDELTKDEKIVGFFHALVTRNESAMKALAEGVDADGGYLFPNEFLTELIRDLPELNVMRNWVRIIPMKRNKMDITSLVSGPDVFWTAENAVKSTTTARFSQQTLTAFKLASILYSSDELIEDSDTTDVVSTIINLFAEAIAEEEERVIWVGDGTTQPQGIDTARSAGTIASISGSGTIVDDIISLFYKLSRKYRTNAVFFMNDNTAKNLEKVKDADNRPLWQPSLTEGAPDRLKGKPVVISDWVPDNTVYFGDSKKGYFLGDRKRMTVKVSQDTTQAFTQDMTAIRVVHRIGGKVVLGSAFKALISIV